MLGKLMLKKQYVIKRISEDGLIKPIDRFFYAVFNSKKDAERALEEFVEQLNDDGIFYYIDLDYLTIITQYTFVTED
jgi:hypothetical protein